MRKKRETLNNNHRDCEISIFNVNKGISDNKGLIALSSSFTKRANCLIKMKINFAHL